MPQNYASFSFVHYSMCEVLKCVNMKFFELLGLGLDLEVRVTAWGEGFGLRLKIWV